MKLLSITTADKEFNFNSTIMINESSLWEHFEVETSKPLDKNLSFINDTYTLNKTSIHDTFIRLENSSMFLSNAVVIGSKILVGGMMDYSVLIENSVFEDSEIVINSASNVTIVYSHFIIEDRREEEEAKHVVKVYNVGILFMTYTYFGKLENQSIQGKENDSGHSKMKNSTNLGFKLENVRIAQLKSCTFAGIRAEKSNGSAMLLKNTDILMESCHFNSNMANNGVIFGENSVNITTSNSSFLSNHAIKSGAVFYLTKSCSITNDGSIFQNNSARDHAGVVFVMYDVTINNRGCLFQHNSALTGHGSVIWMQYDCQLTNRQVL